MLLVHFIIVGVNGDHLSRYVLLSVYCKQTISNACIHFNMQMSLVRLCPQESKNTIIAATSTTFVFNGSIVIE